ncbi:MAG TPA: hypothetical protein VK714_14800 [Myxococcota bacterium]|nr:hypothetical protein [Myxococcota bacterium]
MTKIDVTTLRFGPKGASPISTQIVSVDGQSDLVASFQVQDTGLAVGDTQACLQGEISGQLFRGCDDVVVIMPRGCGLGLELAPCCRHCFGCGAGEGASSRKPRIDRHDTPRLRRGVVGFWVGLSPTSPHDATPPGRPSPPPPACAVAEYANDRPI